ncbi:glycosyltransferase [Xylanimonas allomyrinae]|nr:glycosyltransferase [Xylanimonas allomyrinae]
MAPESAIADVMTQAVAHLATEWEIDIWCPGSRTLRPSPVRVVPFAQPDLETATALGAYDLVIYALGDSSFHAAILPLARRVPGLAVVHDASLTNLVLFTARQDEWLEDLVAHVRREHGADKAAYLRDPGDSGGTETWLRLCAEVTLADVAVEHSLGAVVHSRWHAQQIDGRLLGDVSVARLPVPHAHGGNDEEIREVIQDRLDALDDDAVLLVTVGHVNANRGLGVLLAAIAEDPALKNVHLWAVGTHGAQVGTVVRLADELGLGARFEVPGRVSDGELRAILHRADIAAALREPVLEGQSASVLTQMQAGLPVIVYNHAHYAELPDDAVVKASPVDRIASVREAIRSLAHDCDLRTAKGTAAREYVLGGSTGAAYADGIRRAADLALARRPYVHLAEDLTSQLRRNGLSRKSVVIDNVTSISLELFDLD